MTAIIDYGVGNLFSLKSSFSLIGEDVIVTDEKTVIENADRIILPGVGAFGDAMLKLKEKGLDVFLKQLAEKGKIIMGICLGMQLLFEKSYEYGEHEGLGLIRGRVVPLEGRIDSKLKIPHMGWNALEIKKQNGIFKYINNGDYVYFVHSYFAVDCEESVIADAEYDIPVTAAVCNKNVMGCQFHPEKSGEVGLNILRAFCELKEGELC